MPGFLDKEELAFDIKRKIAFQISSEDIDHVVGHFASMNFTYD